MVSSNDSEASVDSPARLLTGVQSVFQAFGFMLREPKTWAFALVPVAIAILIQGGLALLTWKYSAALTAWFASWAHESVSGVLSTFARTTLTLLAAWAAYYLACLLAPPLSAPALEALVALQERELGVPARASSSWVSEFWCGLKAALTAAAIFGPPALLLTLVSWLVPPAAPMIGPLQFLVVSLAIAYNLLDYPLTLRGVGVRQRLGMLKAHAGASLGFGVCFAALFAVPCFGMLMLPVGVVAATRLHWRLAPFSDASETIAARA